MTEDDPASVTQQLLAAVALDGGLGREPILFDIDGLDKIAQLIDSFLDSYELFDVIETILVIAHLLETEQESPNTALNLVALVERTPVIESLRTLNQQKEAEQVSEVAETAEKFTEFIDTESDRLPAQSEEEKSEGAIRVGDLAFPKRL